MAWKHGKLERVQVLSKAGKPCKLKYKGRIVEFDTQRGHVYRFNGQLNPEKGPAISG